jgi:hypothetical protein
MTNHDRGKYLFRESRGRGGRNNFSDQNIDPCIDIILRKGGLEVNQMAPDNNTEVNQMVPGNNTEVNQMAPDNNTEVNQMAPDNNTEVNQMAPGNNQSWASAI